MSEMGERRVKSLLFLSIFLILAAIYSLIYSGSFSTDDEHLLSAQAINLAFDKDINYSRVLGNSRVYQYSIYSKTSADQALNIEPAQAFLGSFLVRLSILLKTGRVQTLFLLNIWAVALTAAVLFRSVVHLGYQQKTGIIVSLLFGLGTMAFPYSKTYFRDPLAMCFLCFAWDFAIQLRKNFEKSFSGGWGLWVGFGLSMLAGILTKNTILIALPVLLLYILLPRLVHPGARTKTRRVFLILGIFSFILVLAAIFWVKIISQIPLMARFSPDYYGFLVKFFVSTPHPNFIYALLGPLVSPGKSIFLFSPVLILSIWSLIKHFRQSWSAWLFFFFLIIAQALFYDAGWAGHNNWGPRYLLPVIPPLILTISPIVEKCIEQSQKITGLLVLSFVSVFVQLLGIFAPVNEYFVQKASSFATIDDFYMVWNVRQSILPWSFHWLITGGKANLAINRVNIAPALIIGFLVLAIVGTVLISFRKGSVLLLILPFALLAALNFSMLYEYRNDPAYSLTRRDFQEAQANLAAQLQKEDIVFIKSYGSPVWYYFMNWSDSSFDWVSLPYYYPSPALIKTYAKEQDPEKVMDSNMLAIFQKYAISGNRIWLILPEDTPGASLGIEEKWLAQRSSQSNCKTYTDSISTKLCFYLIH